MIKQSHPVHPQILDILILTILKLCKQITKCPKYAILDTAYMKPTINES